VPAEPTVPAPQEGTAATPAPGPAPSQIPAPNRDAAVVELDAALTNVRNAQQSGDLAQLGSAFERLQAAIDAYQAAGG
jgi:uncharacterized protein